VATKAAPVAPKPVAVPKTIAHDRIIVVPGNTTTVAASPPPAPDSQAALVKTYNGNIFTMDNIPSSLANSVFYEYYRAGASGNATVSAWSSDAQQYYSTVCSSDGTMVSCYPQAPATGTPRCSSPRTRWKSTRPIRRPHTPRQGMRVRTAESHAPAAPTRGQRLDAGSGL
jgi:hypothetical protein